MAIYTNNIESFWAIVKRAWFGQHPHYSRRYTDLYIQEACYKQNMPKENGAKRFAYSVAVCESEFTKLKCYSNIEQPEEMNVLFMGDNSYIAKMISRM